MKFRPQLKLAAWGVSLALVAGTMAMTPAYADPWGEASQGDSGYGVNTVMGDKINPRGLNTTTPTDDNGLGPFRAPVAHTPTGQLYSVPWTEPDDPTFYGSLEFGFVGSFGDKDAAKFEEYGSPHGGIDDKNGVGITNFNFYTEKNNHYFTIAGGDVGLNDQYYNGAVGAYNDWRLRFFYTEIPHVYATNVKSIYDESTLGSTYLRLKQPLQYTGNTVAGNQNVNDAQVEGTGAGSIASVVNSSSDTTLSIKRQRAGLRFDQRLTSNWSLFTDYTQEHRKGDMPWSQTGGGFPGNLGGVGNSNGQPINVVAPVNFTQRDVATGIAYSGKHDLLNLSVQVSTFNDADREVYWENPFDSPYTGNGADANGNVVTNRHVQQFTMYPDNKAYYVKGDYTHLFSFWDSSFSTNLQYGWLQNHTPLEPTTSASGCIAAGCNTAPNNDLSYWNSLYGPNGLPTLSRLNTDIDNTNYVMNFNWNAHPIQKLTVGLNARFYGYNDNNDYLSCNPSLAAAYQALGTGNGLCDPATNQTAPIYGFSAEDGNGTSNNALGGWSLLSQRIGNYDTTYTQKNFGARADYALSRNIALNVNFTDELIDRSQRERAFTREPRIKLGLVDRGLGGGTLRLSYEYANRTGGAYNPAFALQTYCAAYNADPTQCAAGFLPSLALPAFDIPIDGTKPDTDNRRENVIIGRYNYMFTSTLDGMLNGKYKSDVYPEPYGRDARREATISAELNYQPTTTTGAYASLSYQKASQGQQSLALTNFGGGPTNTCVTLLDCDATVGDQYSVFGQNIAAQDSFHYNMDDKNWFFNAGLNHVFPMARFDGSFTYEHTNTSIGYNAWANSTGLSLAGDPFSFPSQVWNRYQLNLNVTVPVNKNLGVRFAYLFDRAAAADWHYNGLSNYSDAPVGTYYLSGDPDAGFTVNSIMALIQYKM